MSVCACGPNSPRISGGGTDSTSQPAACAASPVSYIAKFRKPETLEARKRSMSRRVIRRKSALHCATLGAYRDPGDGRDWTNAQLAFIAIQSKLRCPACGLELFGSHSKRHRSISSWKCAGTSALIVAIAGSGRFSSVNREALQRQTWERKAELAPSADEGEAAKPSRFVWLASARSGSLGRVLQLILSFPILY